MTHMRTCQECGYKQIANHPSTYNDESWRLIKCLRCKSEALDYGCEEKEMKSEPVLIKQRTENYDIDNDTLEKAIGLFTKLRDLYGNDAKIRFNTNWEGDTSFEIEYETEETAEEKLHKILASEKLIEVERQKRLAEYEKLKKEFE